MTEDVHVIKKRKRCKLLVRRYLLWIWATGLQDFAEPLHANTAKWLQTGHNPHLLFIILPSQSMLQELTIYHQHLMLYSVSYWQCHKINHKQTPTCFNNWQINIVGVFLYHNKTWLKSASKSLTRTPIYQENLRSPWVKMQHMWSGYNITGLML